MEARECGSSPQTAVRLSQSRNCLSIPTYHVNEMLPPSAEEAIDKLVANVAETEAKNPPIATRNVKSVAEEQLEICYEQIEALK